MFRRLLAVPGVYDAFHFSALRPGNRLARYTERARGVAAAAEGREPPGRASRADLVVSVFATAAGAVEPVQRDGVTAAHMVFCTDVTPHRLWVHPGTDLFLVTRRWRPAGVRRYRPDAGVAVVPAPLRPAFYAPPTKGQARRESKVPEDARCVLLMSGAWGLGPVAAAAAALGAAGVHVLAVAGRNQELEARLRAVARREPRVHALGYSDRVPALMAAADLIVTSSGDTCSEARAIGRRLLLLDVVPGHGRDNLQHELELGHADVTGAAPRDVVRAALAALERPTPPPSAGSVRAPWEAAFGAALSSVGRS